LFDIFLGGVNYSRELPPGSFINAGEFSSPEDLSNHLYYLLKVNSSLCSR